MYLLARIHATRCLSTRISAWSVNYRGFYATNVQDSPIIAQGHGDVSSGRDDDIDNHWKMRKKVVCTSPNLFPHSPNGLCFNVAYLDSGAEWNQAQKDSSPTILAVHGCPATHEDVMPVVKPFHDKGCRVMAINMPGYQHTLGVSKLDHDLFQHSTPDIAEFLGHFLKALEIRQVDMLVGHSGGSLPCATLAGVSDQIKSVMHICPPPGHYPPHSARPHFLIKLLPKIYDTRLGKIILKPFVPHVNRKLSGMNSDRPSHLINAARYAANIDFTLLPKMAEKLQEKKVPSLFVYSSNDSLIETRLSREWGEMLGFQEANFDKYDNDFNLEGSAVNLGVGDYKKGVLFARGGHFPQFKSHTALPILLKEAEKLLETSLTKSNLGK